MYSINYKKMKKFVFSKLFLEIFIHSAERPYQGPKDIVVGKGVLGGRMVVGCSHPPLRYSAKYDTKSYILIGLKRGLMSWVLLKMMLKRMVKVLERMVKVLKKMLKRLLRPSKHPSRSLAQCPSKHTPRHPSRTLHRHQSRTLHRHPSRILHRHPSRTPPMPQHLI